VVRHALSEDQAVLADKLAALRIALKEGGSAQFADELTAPSAGERSPYWIRVLASGTGQVAETSGMTELLTSDIFPPPALSRSADRGMKNYRAGTKLFSLVTISEESHG